MSAIIVVGLLVAVVVDRLSGPKPLTPQTRAALRQYELVRSALAADDLSSARTAATGLSRAIKDQTALLDEAQILSKSTSLEVARYAFKTISDDAIKLVKSQPGYYVVGCSMNDCPAGCASCRMANFGDWVQVSGTVENPYMGKASPRCGIVRRDSE